HRHRQRREPPRERSARQRAVHVPAPRGHALHPAGTTREPDHASERDDLDHATVRRGAQTDRCCVPERLPGGVAGPEPGPHSDGCSRLVTIAPCSRSSSASYGRTLLTATRVRAPSTTPAAANPAE